MAFGLGDLVEGVATGGFSLAAGGAKDAKEGLTGSGKAGPHAGYTQEQATQDQERNRNLAGQVGQRGPVQADMGYSKSMYNRASQDYGRSLTDRNAQLQALDLQRQAALGNAPSVAQIQMQQGADQAVKNQMALAAGARGGGYASALANQQAQRAGADLMQRNVAQSAALRANEMAQARAAYGQGTNDLRSAEQAERALSNQAAQQSGQLALGQGQLELGSRSANDEMQRFYEQQALAGRQLAQQGDIANQAANTQASMGNAQMNNAFWMGLIGAGAKAATGAGTSGGGGGDVSSDKNLKTNERRIDDPESRPTATGYNSDRRTYEDYASQYDKDYAGPIERAAEDLDFRKRPKREAHFYIGALKKYETTGQADSPGPRPSVPNPVRSDSPSKFEYGSDDDWRRAEGYAAGMSDEDMKNANIMTRRASGLTDYEPTGSYANEGKFNQSMGDEYREAFARPEPDGGNRGLYGNVVDYFSDENLKKAPSKKVTPISADDDITHGAHVSSGPVSPAQQAADMDLAKRSVLRSAANQGVHMTIGPVSASQNAEDMDMAMRSSPPSMRKRDEGVYSFSGTESAPHYLTSDEKRKVSVSEGTKSATYNRDDKPDNEPNYTPHPIKKLADSTSEAIDSWAEKNPGKAAFLRSTAADVEAHAYGTGQKIDEALSPTAAGDFSRGVHRDIARSAADLGKATRKFGIGRDYANEGVGIGATDKAADFYEQNGGRVFRGVVPDVGLPMQSTPGGAAMEHSYGGATSETSEMPGVSKPTIVEAPPPAVTSDERAKSPRVDAETPVSHFLNKIHPYEYEYKDIQDDPSHENRMRIGIMAQDAMKTPVGRSMIDMTPRGLAINEKAGLSVAFASLADLDDRIRKIEGKRRG